MRNNVCARKVKSQTQNIMKQFNLDEYLANPSKKVVTRDGRSVRIICTDRVNFDSPVMALVMMKSGIENVYSYRTNGQLFRNAISDQDLFFAPEKHEGWTPVYRSFAGKISFGCAYSTQKEAEEAGKGNVYYLTTTKVEWEE